MFNTDRQNKSHSIKYKNDKNLNNYYLLKEDNLFLISNEH